MTNTLTGVNKIIGLLANDGFNSLFKTIQAVSMTDNCLTCRYQVNKTDINSLRTLHGGFISGATDFVSSIDLVRLGRISHVSVHLGVDYMKPAALGSSLLIESRVMNAGKRLAFCDVLFKNEETGEIVARGTHTKYMKD